MQLASMLKDKIEAWIEVSGYPGFEVHLTYLSRAEIEKIRKAATSTRFDRKTHQKVEEVDSNLFVSALVKGCIKNWRGFTLEYCARMLPIDVPADTDPKTTLVEYSEENAYSLVKESPEFDTWLNEVIFDLEHFRNSNKT